MMRFFLFIILLFGFTSTIAQEIQWMSLNEALEAQKKEPKKIFIDVYTVWCGPCKAIAPIVEEIANDYDGKVKVGKMDVDNNNQVAMKYGIRSIPTLLLFKNGEVVDQVIGNVGKDSIESMLSKAL